MQLKPFYIPLYSSPSSSTDLLMIESDSIWAASLHTVPTHHKQRWVGLRKLVLVQCFYCVVSRPQPLWGSWSQCGPKLSQLHQSELRHYDLYLHGIQWQTLDRTTRVTEAHKHIHFEIFTQASCPYLCAKCIRNPLVSCKLDFWWHNHDQTAHLHQPMCFL